MTGGRYYVTVPKYFSVVWNHLLANVVTSEEELKTREHCQILHGDTYGTSIKLRGQCTETFRLVRLYRALDKVVSAKHEEVIKSGLVFPTKRST